MYQPALGVLSGLSQCTTLKLHKAGWALLIYILQNKEKKRKKKKTKKKKKETRIMQFLVHHANNEGITKLIKLNLQK